MNLQTKMDEYLQLQKTTKVGDQERIIMHYLEINPSGLSRKDIHEYLKEDGSRIEYSTVCARMNGLLHKGKAVIIDRKVTKNQQIIGLASKYPWAIQQTRVYLEEVTAKKIRKMHILENNNLYKERSLKVKING